MTKMAAMLIFKNLRKKNNRILADINFFNFDHAENLAKT